MTRWPISSLSGVAAFIGVEANTGAAVGAVGAGGAFALGAVLDVVRGVVGGVTA